MITGHPVHVGERHREDRDDEFWKFSGQRDGHVVRPVTGGEPTRASRPQGIGCWFEQSSTQARTRTFESWAGGTDEEKVTQARRSSVSLVYALTYWLKVSWVLPGECLVTLPLTLLLADTGYRSWVSIHN